MKVCIFGVGRSGTSALYALLQKVMADQLGETPDFLYEPFLWDRKTFNSPHEKNAKKFLHIDSLSTEGLYHHQAIPLFLSEAGQYKDHPFIRSLTTPAEGKNHLLLKAIRMNGRFEAFCESDPDVKFIFIMRNPIDVVNSVTRLFSFFGSDFHRDDSDRFTTAVQDVFNERPRMETHAERSSSYWYYMNRFVLERLEKYGDRILALPYEFYTSEKEKSLKAFCTFLGLKYRDSYLALSENPAGVVTRSFHLTKSEYLEVAKLAKEYCHFLEQIGYPGFTEETFLQKYTGAAFLEEPYQNPYEGRTANTVRRALVSNLEKSSKHLKREAALEEENRKLTDRLRKQDREIEVLTETLSIKERNLGRKKEVIRQQTKNLETQKRHLRQVAEEREHLKNSASYKIGKAVTKPFSLLGNLIGPQKSRPE